MMATDAQHGDGFDGEATAPSRALVVPTLRLSSVTFTPLLTVLAAQLSNDASAGTLSSYSAAVESYRAAAARVPQLDDTDISDA